MIDGRQIRGFLGALGHFNKPRPPRVIRSAAPILEIPPMRETVIVVHPSASEEVVRTLEQPEAKE